MTDNTERIIRLLTKRLTTPLSADEADELRLWIGDNPEREALSERLSDYGRLADAYRKRSIINPENACKDMRRRIGIQNKRKRMAGNVAWAMVAVAAVLLFVWFAIPSEQMPKQDAPALIAYAPLSIDSLKPGATIAFINDGGHRMAVESEDEINGIISSRSKSGNSKEKKLTLEVPRGGEFIVLLEDSTKVWLNSESSLSYPESFSAESRRVRISGEAYFDVAPDASRPFFVECDGQEIQVYGTEFNVRAYPEDEAVFTSLSEGSIALRRLDKVGGELMLSPGKQAVFNKSTRHAEVKDVNIETITRWRHGRFVFENQTLLQIMYDLSRWYDFRFEFADPELENLIFMGSIPRYGDFSTATLILEKSGDVAFHTNGDKIIVSRKKSHQAQ